MNLKKPKPLGKTLYRSLGTTIEQLPSGKLDAYETLKGDIPDRPEWLVCDCCLQKSDRLWFYAHYGFCTFISGCRRTEYVAGGWAFCVYCHALMADAPLLVARVAALTGIEPPVLRETYDTMLQCLYGEPEYWESGRPYRRTGLV